MAVFNPVCYILTRIGLEQLGSWALFVVIGLGNKINLILILFFFLLFILQSNIVNVCAYCLYAYIRFIAMKLFGSQNKHHNFITLSFCVAKTIVYECLVQIVYDNYENLCVVGCK
jgi:hypothetical protein